jgi:diguanylate cyclase (GGDEF)-like protein
VYGGGRTLGKVVVSASPTPRLLDAARAPRSNVELAFVVGGDVRATSPANASRDLAGQLRTRQNDTLLLSNAPEAAGLTAFVDKPSVFLGWLWPLLVGLVAGAAALAYFRRVEDRRRAEPPPKTVRDAVALVGETLAATHNPDALLPVILQAAIEATDASGGSITSGEIVLASRGGAGAPAARDPIEFPLQVAGGRSAVLSLYPPASGFTDEERDAAAWIAAQALIALENAHLHGLVQRQAVTDELTGLANRRRFLAQMDAEVARSRRSGAPLAVVLADLDNFKQVNDKYGHEAGDSTLRAFAEILRGAVRDVDLPVRLGGEEFAILLPDTDLVGGANLAERLRVTLERHQIESGSARIRVTASFGVSCYPLAVSADDLLVDADRRLYDAKRRGKNRVEVSGSANHAELA